jgi:hypothetical protein
VQYLLTPPQEKRLQQKEKMANDDKNYSIRDSRLVTHDSTSQTISCLNRAERTGCVVFIIL